MVFEAGSPEGDMTIESCNAPSHLAVATTDDYGTWRLEARLAEANGVTLLTLVQHLEYYASLT